jgi:hypothetical protein
MAQVNLSELSKAAGGTRVKSEPEPESREAGKQKSRRAAVPITVFQPEQVRTQLKMLVVEHSDTIENKVAEALNDLFAKYGKPEIAVVKPRRTRES